MSQPSFRAALSDWSAYVSFWLRSEVSPALALVRCSPISRHSGYQLPLSEVEQTRLTGCV
jgi:hypothetical protein